MSTITPNVNPNVAMPPMPGGVPGAMPPIPGAPVGAPAAPSFGAMPGGVPGAMPPMPPGPMPGGMPGAMPPMPGAQPTQGAIAVGATTTRTSNVVICGYIAPQQNALKRVIDEAACRKAYKAIYEAMSDEQKANLGERQCLNADGEGQTTTDKKPKMVNCNNTFSMTAFRTFMRADGQDKLGNVVPGFETIRDRQTYAVDMSENTAEYWVVKYIVGPGADSDMAVTSALAQGHVFEYNSGLTCFKNKQFHKFVYAIGKPVFPIVSLNALKVAQETNSAPIVLGLLACKKSGTTANGAPKINLGVYSNDFGKCSVRQLGLNDDGSRSDSVSYIVLRRNTHGEAVGVSPEQVTNLKTFKAYFPDQDVTTLSRRKTFTKAEYAGPGLTDDDVNEKFKAAKAAELIPFDNEKTKAFCNEIGLVAEKYADLGISRPPKRRGMKPSDFRSMTDDALTAINEMMRPQN